MRFSPLLLSLALAACTAPKDDGADTDLPDTDTTDTDVLDTDILDTDVVDTDVPDTDVPDTDVLDTDIADTDVDLDVDGDGVIDVVDGCPNGQSGWISDGATDYDSDGCLDNSAEDLDDDNDASLDGADCESRNAAIHPGATEVCDLLDNDCANGPDDGFTREVLYPDADNDGFGDPATSIFTCTNPSGYVTDSSDCDDTEPDRFPGATEACGEELDCDAGTVAACPTTFADVHPIYRQHCTPCHSTGGSGGHNIASSNITTAYNASQLGSYTVSGETKGFATLVRIHDGSMPQGAGCTGNPVTDAANAACLDAAEQALIQAWIDDGQLQ